jgi:hypothetical protein
MKQDIRIVVLQRGWVYVGRYSNDGQGKSKLEGASCIRRWGTSKGLGELIDGPLDSTTLDKAGIVRFDDLTVVNTIDCNGEKWVKHCN